MKLKRIVSSVLCVSIFFSQSINIFAETAAQEKALDQQLEAELRGNDEFVKQYPKGQFDFLAAKMNASENLDSVEIAVVRKGGTEGEVSVDLKAIDISAKYGEDYVIKVEDSFFKSTLDKNPDAKPLVEAYSNVSDITKKSEEANDVMAVIDSTVSDSSITVNSVLGKEFFTNSDEKTKAYENKALEKKVQEETQEKDTVFEEESVSDSIYEDKAENYDKLSEETTEESNELSKSHTPVGLKNAKNAFTGEVSDRRHWSENTDTSNKDAFVLADESIIDWADEIPGVSTTLTFADGEYMKTITVDIIDDNISESDEQVLFVISNPSEGELGNVYKAYLNIEDNDKQELQKYEMAQSETAVRRTDGYSEITIRRTSGKEKFGSVYVSTAEITAKHDVDYKSFAEEVVFPQGISERTIYVPILKEDSRQDGLQFKITLDKSSDIVNTSKAETIITINNDNKEFALETGELSLLSEDEQYEEIAGLKHDKNGYYTEYVFDENENISLVDNGNSDKTQWTGNNSIYVNGNGTEKTWSINDVDLTMVKQIAVDWENNTKGTYWEKKKCNKVTASGYYTDGDNWVTFGSNDTKFKPSDYSNIKFSRQTTTISLPEKDNAKKTKSNITFHTKTDNSNQYSNLKIYSVKLYYAPFSISISTNLNPQTDNNTAKNALVDAKEWTVSRDNSSDYSFDSNNNTSYKIKTKSITAGTLKFSDSKDTKRNFYYGKTISFNPQYKLSKDKVYLAGILISNGSKEKLLEGKTSITLNSTFFAENKDYISNAYGSNPSFTVYPVYYPKPSFIYFPATRNGYMVSHNKVNSTDIMKVSRLDTVKLQAAANKGKFVSGFNVYTADSTGISTDKASTEKTIAQFRRYNLNTANRNFKTTKNGVTWNQNDPSYITIEPYTMAVKIEPYYDNPYLTVKANPKNSNKSKGAVYYSDGKTNIAGNYKTPIVIKPMDMGKTYSINSISENGYSTKWQDFTGDKNSDGKIDSVETKELENYNIDRSAVVGSVFNYIPGKFAVPLIYYGFYPEYTSADKGTVEGYLKLKKQPVFSTKTTKTPISGATITISDMTTTTDESGYYCVESSKFADADKAMVSAYFDGNFYNYTQDVNAAKLIDIDEYTTFSVTSAKLYKDSEEIKPSKLENFDKTLKIEIGTKSDSSVLICSKALFKSYDKNGNLICSDTVTSKDGSGFFIYEMNPATKGITPGATMTVQFFDQNDKGYIVHDMGLKFSRSLDTFNILTSFESPIKPALELIGKVDASLGLGLSGKSENYFSYTTKTENGQSIDYKTLSFGFSKGWNSESDTSGEESKLDKLTNAIKESANGTGTSNEVQQQVKDATDTSKNGNKKEIEISAQTSVSIAIGLDLVMQKSEVQEGEYFFKDLIFTVTCDGGIGMEAEIPTPIYVNIVVGFNISGEINGAIVISKGRDAKESYFDGNGGIDLGNMTMLTKDEAISESNAFTFYGSIEVIPTIKLTAGASLASVLKVTVSGEAKFDLNFDTLGNSSGDITMTAYIGLKVLLFEKEWKLASTTISMFDLKGNNNLLYDSIDSMKKADISYMKQRGNWDGGGISLSSLDVPVTENTLLKGSNPYPGSIIKKLSDGKYMLVFIDDDISKDEYNYATVKYSVYSGGNWSEPVSIDNDDTADESPDLFVLDNGMVMAVWSSAGEKITADDNAIEAMNKMNIKSAIYNGSSFSEPVWVTHTTAADYSADTLPKLASGTIGGKERIILYYSKTEYEATEEDGVIGDLVNPYSVTAYMFYDVENGEWVNTYSQEDKDEIISTGIAHTSSGELVTEDNFNVYESEWYGQGFVSLGSNVVINDFDKTDENGFWTSVPEITAGNNNVDPMIVDSSVISYDNLSIFAYTVDFDQNQETTYDREIYTQVYDFNTNEFFHPIQITSNNVSDSAVKLGRFGDSTYIIWISDGKIKYFNFSNAYKNCLLEKEINGEKVYVIDKSSKENFIPEGIVADAGENVEIGEFEAAADSENNVYVLWTQAGLTYKNGIDQASEEATKPENQYSENQIYMARYNADSNLFGKWSAPVQITDEQGANYSNAAFAVANGGVTAVVTKGMSKVDSQYGAREDISSRTLTSLNFNTVDKLSLSDLNFAEHYGDNTVLTEVTIKNKGFEDHNDIYAEFYSNGVKSEAVSIKELNSGDETVVSATVPVGAVEVKLYTSTGIADTISSEITAEPNITIDSLYAEIISRNLVGFKAEITNNGTASVKNADIKVVSDTTGNVVGETVIENLDMGETMLIDFYVDIDDNVYQTITPENEEYYCEEAASFIISPEYGNSTKASIVRYLTNDEKNLLDSVSPILNDGAKSITVASNDYELVYDNITDENAKLKVRWESSDENVATVNANGLVSGISKGSAVITAKIMPSDRTIVVLSDGSSKSEDIYAKIHEEGIITKTIDVNVVEGSEENTTETGSEENIKSNNSSGGGSSKRSNSKAAQVKTTETEANTEADTENKSENSSSVSDEETNYQNNVFDDVKGTWAEKAVMYLAEKGIVSGIGDNMFAPERNVTRAEFITMLMRMLNIDADISGETVFSDIPSDAYYYEYVLKAKALGIAAGYNDNTFKPNENISRQDMFAFTERALTSLGKIEADDSYSLSYSDIDSISEYAKESIRILSSIGIVNGSENLVKPLDNAKRNEAAQMIYNIVLLIVTE